MINKNLFSEFQPVSTKQWKQQIQFDLKGADYNETLVWESPEGIKVKPFYNNDDLLANSFKIKTRASEFKILQNIFVHDVAKSNKRAINTLSRGAEQIRFTITNEATSITDLMTNLPLQDVSYFFNLTFLSTNFVKNLTDFAVANQATFFVQNDPIYNLTATGNWYQNFEKDFENIGTMHDYATEASATVKPFFTSILSCKSTIYQNAGANITQQLAYTLAHINEYFNFIPNIKQPIVIEVAIGTNYLFEIAKIRALRLLFKTLAQQYNHNFDCHIIATPTKRNKTIYDYNINMLRTTTECMSAILGGADAIANLSYDNLYHKDNEFGDRIARNQLLILKEESYFNKVNNPADGAYYIENLTKQLAEKALQLFKEIEAKGGFIAQLINGNIQKKIYESAQKEQNLFNSGHEVLLGTNKHPNKNDRMKNDLELHPFAKFSTQKTLIIPIIETRLAEKTEQERLAQEQ